MRKTEACRHCSIRLYTHNSRQTGEIVFHCRRPRFVKYYRDILPLNVVELHINNPLNRVEVKKEANYQQGCRERSSKDRHHRLKRTSFKVAKYDPHRRRNELMDAKTLDEACAKAGRRFRTHCLGRR